MRLTAVSPGWIQRAAWALVLLAAGWSGSAGESRVDGIPEEPLTERYATERKLLQGRIEAAVAAPDPWEQMPQLRLAISDLALAHGDLRFAMLQLLGGLEWITPDTASETRRRLFDHAIRVAVEAGFPGQARLILRRMEQDGFFMETHPRAVSHQRAAEIAEADFNFEEMEQALARFAGEVTGETCPDCIADYWILRTRAALRQRNFAKAATFLAEARASVAALATGPLQAQVELLEAWLLQARRAAPGEVQAQLLRAREAFKQAGMPAHYPLGLARLIRARSAEPLVRANRVVLEGLAEYANEEENFLQTVWGFAARSELARRERRFESAHADLRISHRKGDHFNRVMARMLSEWEASLPAQPPELDDSARYYLLVLVLILVVLILLLALRVRTQQLLAGRLRELIGQSQRAEQAATEANRLKSQFLANVSHEIKTPMAGLMGMVSVLDEVVTDPAQRRYLETVQTCSQNLLKLINNLLELSRMESGRFEIEQVPFTLAETFQYCRGLVAPRAREKGLQLLMEIDPGVPEKLVGDPLRLGQVLVNLLHNALQFTPQGRVAMRAFLEPADSAAGELVIEVSDTGVGIAPERLHTLFEPFSRAQAHPGPAAGGSGLGLAISRKLAQLLGGTLTVVSSLGEGSTFTLRIPVGL